MPAEPALRSTLAPPSSLKAKMVGLAVDMPVQYSGVIDEHNVVTASAFSTSATWANSRSAPKPPTTDYVTTNAVHR